MTRGAVKPLQPIIIPSPELERWLDSHVPYRIQMLHGLTIYNEQGGPDGPLRPVFPCIFEGALIACRWAANFLGVRVNKDGSSLKRPERKDFDVFVCDLGGKLIDPAALSADERSRLISVLKGANRASAHATREGSHSMAPEEVEPAAALLIEKVKTHLYDVLDKPIPKWKG